MRAEIDTADEVTIVRVRGEFDLSGVDLFRQVVAEAGDTGTGVVEIDLRDVSFIDSSGVGAIVVAARDATAGGRHIRIGARSSVVERVLQVSGVEQALREAGARDNSGEIAEGSASDEGPARRTGRIAFAEHDDTEGP